MIITKPDIDELFAHTVTVSRNYSGDLSISLSSTLGLMSKAHLLTEVSYSDVHTDLNEEDKEVVNKFFATVEKLVAKRIGLESAATPSPDKIGSLFKGLDDDMEI